MVPRRFLTMSPIATTVTMNPMLRLRVRVQQATILTWSTEYFLASRRDPDGHPSRKDGSGYSLTAIGLEPDHLRQIQENVTDEAIAGIP